MSGSTLTIRINHELSAQDICDIVVTAIEGGCYGVRSWADQVAPCIMREDACWHEMTADERKNWRTKDECGWYANPEFWKHDRHGALFHLEEEDEMAKVPLTRGGIALAFTLLRDEQVQRLITENYDALDADALVQTAVFGQIVFG